MGKESVQDAAYRYCCRARGGERGEARAARALVENGGARTLAEGVPTAALVQHRGDERGGGGDSRRGFASGLGRVDIARLGYASPKSGGMWGAQMASPNPLDSRFRGNDGVEIGSNSAIIASLRPLRLRAFASNSLCQHALGRPTAGTSPILALMNIYSYMRRQVSAGEIRSQNREFSGFRFRPTRPRCLPLLTL